eukprot:COSAG01_NODE_3570_length_5924_cov_4.911588_4_plen_247_part_00
MMEYEALSVAWRGLQPSTFSASMPLIQRAHQANHTRASPPPAPYPALRRPVTGRSDPAISAENHRQHADDVALNVPTLTHDGWLAGCRPAYAPAHELLEVLPGCRALRQRGALTTRVRCVSIFLDKNRRYIGKSQSKQPLKRTQRTPHQPSPSDPPIAQVPWPTAVYLPAARRTVARVTPTSEARLKHTGAARQDSTPASQPKLEPFGVDVLRRTASQWMSSSIGTRARELAGALAEGGCARRRAP